MLCVVKYATRMFFFSCTGMRRGGRIGAGIVKSVSSVNITGNGGEKNFDFSRNKESFNCRRCNDPRAEKSWRKLLILSLKLCHVILRSSSI